MKFPKTILVNTLKSIVVLCFITSLASCDSDDGKVLVDSLPESLLRTYVGSVSYTDSDGEIIAGDFFSSATISGSFDDYTITFSEDDVPTLTNLSFERVGPLNFEYIDGTDEIIINTVLVVDFEVNGNRIEFSGQ